MTSLRYAIGGLLCLALGISYAAGQVTAPEKAQSAKAHAHHRATPRPKKQEEPPPPPPPQPQPKDLPAVAPQVRYQNGLLTVVAPNSNLGDVLRAISAQTGARVDVPGAAQNQRVVANLGPAPPEQVVSQLLDGSPFNYVVLGSVKRPGAIDRIVLTPAGPAPGNVNAAAQPPQAAPPSEQETEGDEGAAPEEAPEAAEPEPQPEQPQPEPAQAQPGQQPQNEQPQPPEQQPNQAPEQQQGQPNQAQPNPQQPKTPEQLLQELQMLQQKQKQQQQQENPK